jgi:hypothetical protein
MKTALDEREGRSGRTLWFGGGSGSSAHGILTI